MTSTEDKRSARRVVLLIILAILLLIVAIYLSQLFPPEQPKFGHKKPTLLSPIANSKVAHDFAPIFELVFYASYLAPFLALYALSSPKKYADSKLASPRGIQSGNGLKRFLPLTAGIMILAAGVAGGLRWIYLNPGDYFGLGGIFYLPLYALTPAGLVALSLLILAVVCRFQAPKLDRATARRYLATAQVSGLIVCTAIAVAFYMLIKMPTPKE